MVRSVLSVHVVALGRLPNEMGPNTIADGEVACHRFLVHWSLLPLPCLLVTTSLSIGTLVIGDRCGRGLGCQPTFCRVPRDAVGWLPRNIIAYCGSA
jgi:hypothetical protein